MGKKFIISDKTQKRCNIFKLNPEILKKFIVLNLELFHYLQDVSSIDFTIYFRVGDQMIEFIKPEEFSKELLGQVEAALLKEYDNLFVYIEKREQPKFHNLINSIRDKKIETLLDKDPLLDRKTLVAFSNLSSASQMVVRGGLTSNVDSSITMAAGQMLDQLMDSEIAIGTLSRMVNCDPTLYDHSAAVAMIAGVIATKILKTPLSRKEAEVVTRGGLYHDVGKTCIPNHVLNKPGKLDDEEFKIMKTHTTLGYDEIIQAIEQGAPIEEEIPLVVVEHHERFHGNGYPHGKQGRREENENGIHLYSRIVTIADVYSALLMERVYKPAYDSAKAIKIMADIAEKEYDPDIFYPFLKNVVGSLNHYRKKEVEKSKGKILIIEDGKVKVS